ncbi:MAG TPA: bi-domain-containing oxidoreductase [Thermoanaerobaculia bacterium]
MKQLIQSVKTGELSLLDVPAPGVGARGILVRTHASLVSAGTERMIVSFAEKNLLDKARSRPDLVRQVLDKIQTNGLLDTVDAVRNRLDQAMTMGYSAAGTVIDVGREVTELRVGDRVACAGAGYAVHAQILSVPRNLAVKLEDHVAFEHAAFTTLGAIALHGIRLSAVVLGEVVAVIGLGLLGQLTVQMLKAAGCTVIGTDLQSDRVALALRHGAEWAGTDAGEFAARVAALSSGQGADAVLITADTSSDQPVTLAGEVARNRGRVISVGAVGTTLPRKLYFEKELDFRISRSYGPGRYDPDYEEKGLDYPYGFVRWTENRNMQAFARMLATGAVNAEPLITQRFELEEAQQAYDLILGRTKQPFLGVVLKYSAEPVLSRRIEVGRTLSAAPVTTNVNVGVLGAGLFANAVLIPAMQKTKDVNLVGVASGGGVTARTAAKKFGFGWCASSSEELLTDDRVNTVAILTRHHLHARQTLAALRAGKHVFVEKPLCLTADELHELEQAYDGSRMVMVGYNRRFAPMVAALRDILRTAGEPLMLTYRVNAGFIPANHWTQDPEQGGGRLRGEGCHFIDLLIDLAGDRVRRVTTRVLPDAGRYQQDNFQITLEFEHGSIGTVLYSAGGSKSFGKESVEAFGGGIAARLDDYRSLDVRQHAKATTLRSRLRQDKGHRGEWEAIARHLTQGGPPPIPFAEIVHSTKVTLAAYESLLSGETVTV